MNSEVLTRVLKFIDDLNQLATDLDLTIGHEYAASDVTIADDGKDVAKMVWTDDGYEVTPL